MAKSRARRIQMPIFSAGQSHILVVDAATASTIGSYMNAVSRFLGSNDPEELAEFVGEVVKDTNGTVYALETRSDVLYSLVAADADIFEEVYRIIT